MNKARLSLLAAVLVVLLIITGCSSAEKQQGQPEKPEQPVQYVIEDYVAGSGEESGGGTMPEMTAVLSLMKWFGHASFMFTDEASGNRVYYVDPFEFKGDGKEKADIVFVTHAHFDHCDSDSVKKVIKPDTILVLPNDCKAKLNFNNEFVKVEPNKEYNIKGFKFRTVPAYNTKPDRLQYHPKSNNWVGYIFSLNNQTVYHAGDTDFIPEMKQLGKINVAMLPIGGTYTMDADEAIVAANTIAADVTVPMHYRRLLNEKSAAAEEKFKAGVKNSKVVILEEVAA
ncbi:MBL fold metallo-hydrolase [Candidatus Woesearchaeota archaeon]|nr:MBL fold metallo-hydrolase [Candidatus Woesearchaeota archaeon]